MAVSMTNLTPDMLDRVQLGSTEASVDLRHLPDQNSVDWFLPGNDKSLETIDAVANLDLQGANPESIAERVLSHIGG